MQRVTIYTIQGNTRIVTGGVTSTTLAEGSFPGCTVSVFATGTTNLATIYGDNLNPPTPKANPFTADSTGAGFFYAANSSRVDIQLSGAGIATPFILAGDVLLYDSALPVISAPQTVAFSATPQFDLSLAAWFKITLTGNVTAPTFPNAVAGSLLVLSIIQDGTGGRTWTWPGSFTDPPTPSLLANARTECTFKFDGSTWTMLAATGDSLQAPTSTILKNLNTIRMADAYPGADWTVKVNAADADLGAKGGQIWVSSACGTSGSVPITLRNTLRFIDDASYTFKGISIATGGIGILGMGLTNAGSTPNGTLLTYTGAAGTDAISILGTAIARLDKVVIENILVDGNTLARYCLRVEKCDAGTLRDVRLRNSQAAGANYYVIDAIDWKWYNVGITFCAGYGCIFDGGSGNFAWYGGQFEQSSNATNPQIIISGTNNTMLFSGLDMDSLVPFGGFFAIQGQDGANSSFPSAPAGIGQGRPINITIANCLMTYGGTATPAAQGADILITDASAAQQPTNIALENLQMLAAGLGAVAIKTDQATRVFIRNVFSTGHTQGAATTLVTTANSTLINTLNLISGDSNRISDVGNAVLDLQQLAASGQNWESSSGGYRFGAGTTALPALAFSADTSSGWSRPDAGYWRWSNGGLDVFLLSPGGPIINSAKSYGFSNGDSFGSSTVTGFSWISAGTIGVGNATAGDTSGNLQLTKITKYNGAATAGEGVASVKAITSQKAETAAADANVLTLTPPAAVGTYRVSVAISVASATTGVISWTLSWTDSNGNAQANIAQDLFQIQPVGTAAPAQSFTTSAAGNYCGSTIIDINNAAANIVVKWVGGGTTVAKMSATVERLI